MKRPGQFPPRTSRLARSKEIARTPMRSSRKPIAKRGPAKAKRQKKYKAYLSSAAWKRKRAACLEAAGGQCDAWWFIEAPWTDEAGEQHPGRWVRCTATEDLTAHHLTYARFRHELPGDLQCVCRHCHNRIEATKGKRIA